MQTLEEQERAGMESRNFCAYNRTQGSFLSLRIRSVDALHQSAQEQLQSLADNSQSGLWISPFGVLPEGHSKLIFDLVYLDQDCRVLAVESFPNPSAQPPDGPIASALALPPRTITASITQPGDELIIWSLTENEPQPQRGFRTGRRSRAKSSDEPGTKTSPAEPSAEKPSAHPEEEHEDRTSRGSFFRRLFTRKSAEKESGAPISLFASQTEPAIPSSQEKLHTEAPAPVAGSDPAALEPIEAAEAIAVAQLIQVAEPIVPIELQSAPAVPTEFTLGGSELPAESTAATQLEAPVPAIPLGEAPVTVEPAPVPSPLPIAKPVVEAPTVAAPAPVIEEAKQPSAPVSTPVIPGPAQSIEEPSVAVASRIAPPSGLPIPAEPGPADLPLSSAPTDQASSTEAPQSPIPFEEFPIEGRTVVTRPEPIQPEPGTPAPAAAIPVLPAPAAATAPPALKPEPATSAASQPVGTKAPAMPVAAPVPVRQPHDPAAAPKAQKELSRPEAPSTQQPMKSRRIVAIPGPNGTTYVVQDGDEAAHAEATSAGGSAPLPEALPPVSTPVASETMAQPPAPIAQPPAAPLPAAQPSAPPLSISLPAAAIEPMLGTAPVAASQPVAQGNDEPAPEAVPSLERVAQKASEWKKAREHAKRKEIERREAKRRRFKPETKWPAEKAPTPSLGKRFVKWLTAPPPAAKRMRSPEIVAYFWTGGTPQPHKVLNISVTGLYIVTKFRWLQGTVLVMNLQWTDSDGNHPGDTISVLAKVVRSGEDGVGFQFVTSDAVDLLDGQYIPGKGSDRAALDRFLWRRKRPATKASA